MKSCKNNKAENKKRAENTINPFTLSEYQQPYYRSQFNSVCPSFANATARRKGHELFAINDIDRLVREVCRIYTSLPRRLNFEYLV